MLDNIEVKIENLMLDPNNPRFISDLKTHNHIPDEDVASMQDDALSKFSSKATSDEEDVTNVSDLYQSMITIGYVPIDRIVVKEIQGTNNYLVIEGNRRVSAIKKILYDYNNRSGDFDKLKNRERIEPLLESFNNVSCMFLDSADMSEEEQAHKISLILGLRHHGSLLSWEPLPRAYNIYNEYMALSPVIDEFKSEEKRHKDVSSHLSISTNDVKKSLRTYIVYLQLSDIYSVKNRHYSLIEAGVTNKYLSDAYFNIDKSTFRMDEESLEKMNLVCQFDKRDSINEDVEKKILNDPKAFAKLGKLIAKSRNAHHDAIKRHADDLIKRVEDEEDMDMSLDQALEDLTNMEQSIKWIDSVNKLLDAQESELKYEDYSGIGNDRAYKDELSNKVNLLRVFFKL